MTNPTRVGNKRPLPRNFLEPTILDFRRITRDFADPNVRDRPHRRNPRPLVLHRLTQLRKFALIKTHQPNRHEVDRNWICPCQDHPKRYISRRERSLALTGQDSIDDREYRPHRRRRIEM